MPTGAFDSFVLVTKCLGCGAKFDSHKAGKKHQYLMRKDRNRKYHPLCAK